MSGGRAQSLWLSGPGMGDHGGMARVLVSETISERGLARLREAGHEVDVRLELTPAELAVAVKGAAALIIRSETQVTAEILEAGTDLVVVGRAGIGLDNVDVAAATRRGVMVVNAPQSNVLSAAEHAMALLLAMARNVPQANAALKAGKWERTRWEGIELHGKVLGVVGLGRVGALVAQRASAFGMRLVAYDPFVSADRARQMGVELMSLEELMGVSHFVTIHLPRTKETIGLLGEHMLALARPGLRIVNTARGGILDEAALDAAIRSGRIGGRRPRRVRQGADHRVAPLRAGLGGRHPPPGGEHPGGPGQGGRDHRRAGAAGPERRVRPLRGQRRAPPRRRRRCGPSSPWPSGWAGCSPP